MIRITFPPPVDFQRLLLDLQGLGMRGPDIQSASGLRRGAIGAYKAGQCNPSYDKGEALIRVWCQRTGRGRDQLPRMDERTISAAKVEREERGPTDKLSGATASSAAGLLGAITRGWAFEGGGGGY
ncbi:MAG: hypothetical protein DI563_02565 [Variovorax paradoxus]|uniref:Uncharacterized protein n=1 Tax=Variovorax paradoxus TaxID=34073 RepID=A0A2W5QLG3_VARPD|nr:MAG: hypothetical protein DI563_02565 [Variovorax paradoxus]